METNEGVAEAESTAGSVDGAGADDLALLQALESEETSGRSEDTTNDLTQESRTGSPEGEGAEEDAEAGDDTGGEEEGAEDKGEDDEEEAQPQGRAEKRIAKLIAERNDTRKERDELKAELERVKSGSPQPEGPWDPLSADPEFGAARAAEQKSLAEYRSARDLLRVLDRDPNKALETVAKVFKLENPTEDQARDILEAYRDRHEDLMSEAKAKRIAKETEIRQVNEQAARVWKAEAEADMPWVVNEEDPRQKHLKTILKTHPWITKIPAGHWVAAAAAAKLRQLEVRQQKAAAAKRGGTPERRIVPGAGRTTSTPMKPPGGKQQRLAAAAKRHQEDPSEDSLSEYLGAVAG